MESPQVPLPFQHFSNSEVGCLKLPESARNFQANPLRLPPKLEAIKRFRHDSHPQAIPGGPDLSALHGPSEFIFEGAPVRRFAACQTMSEIGRAACRERV